MIQIDTKAYILRSFADILFFYILFLSVNKHGTIKTRLLFVVFILPITFIVQLFSGFSDIIPILLGYILLKTKRKNDYVLLSDLLICMFITYMISIFSSMIMLLLVSNVHTVGFGYVFIQLFLNGLLISTYLFFYKKKKLYLLVEKYSSESTSFLLTHLFLATLLISYAAHYYDAYDHFIVGIIVFLVIQTGGVIFLFLKMLSAQKEKYQQQLKQQQLISLKKYTEQLEQNQEQLSKFRHDYKNLLLSLKETANIENNSSLLTQLVYLEEYSKSYLSNKTFDYRNFNKIENDYLKSLLISKFYHANKQQVFCQFECSKPICDIPIPIFDCVRIVGILLDNAIEAARESQGMSLSLMIYQDESQLEFLIENNCCQTDISIDTFKKKGMTTKEGHSGLGLSIIQDFNQKNTNMFIQYKKENTIFSTQLILMKHKEEIR